MGKYPRAAFAKKERNKAVCSERQIVRAFTVREVKRGETEERDEYSFAEGRESQSKKQSHPNELSEN